LLTAVLRREQGQQSTMRTPKLNKGQRPHSGLPGTDSVYICSWATMFRKQMLPSFSRVKFRSTFATKQQLLSLSAHHKLGLSSGPKWGISPTFHIKIQTDPAAETDCHFFFLYFWTNIVRVIISRRMRWE